MNWSDFWNKPIDISYGGLIVFLFAVWIVRTWEKYHAERREAVRRYNEKYPFGEYKTRYERGED